MSVFVRSHRSGFNLEFEMARLCGYCGGAVDSIVSVFVQLHRSGFNLEFGVRQLRFRSGFNCVATVEEL